MDDRVTDGLRFECTACGQCCRRRGPYAYVYVNDVEVGRLAEHLGVSAGRFRSLYTFIDEDGWTQLKMHGDACVFLDRQGRCSVYEARPTQCSTFPFWREFVGKRGWKGGVDKHCEGIGRGRVWSREQAEALIMEKERADQE